MHSEQLDELAAALAAAQAELLPALKDVDGQVGRATRKYADLASCWEAVRVCLPRHGLAIVQTARSEGDADFLDTTLLHASGQWMRGSVRLMWGDNPALTPMQCYGSALTYARRYGLAAICGLTAEDDDGASAGRPAQRQPERRPDPPPQPQPAPNGPAGDELDRLLGWWSNNMAKYAGPASEPEAVARRMAFLNHMATAAVKSDAGILSIDDITIDGKRDNPKTQRALRRLCLDPKKLEWLRSEAARYWAEKKAELTAQTV